MPMKELNLMASDVVSEDTGIHMSESSILHDVKDGQAGESPKKKGQTGSIAPLVFANLAEAFESHICINHLNGKSGENVKKIGRMGAQSCELTVSNDKWCKLDKMKKKEIDLDDTALGRLVSVQGNILLVLM